MSTTAALFSSTPQRWPAWLPSPANRPDVADFADTQPSGWFASSLDLKLGLDVVDLGTMEPVAAWDGILT